METAPDSSAKTEDAGDPHQLRAHSEASKNERDPQLLQTNPVASETAGDPQPSQANPVASETTWGPYQLRANPVAILRLSLGTAAAIAFGLLIPDIFALLPSCPNLLTLACRAAGLWGYCYFLWACGFLSILHLVRLLGSPILLDQEGIKLGKLDKKILWNSIEAITVADRKVFSKLFFIPAQQMTIHFTKPDLKGDTKRSSKQIASFQYLPEEFYSLFYHISKRSTGAQPRNLDCVVFSDVANPRLQKICGDGRMKSVVMTTIIAFGLVSYWGRAAVKNYSINLGDLEFNAAHYDKAIADYSTVTMIDFSSAPAWDRLARSEARVNDFDAAEADWKTALQWKPDYVESKLGLSRIYIMRGKFDEAETLVKAANRLAPLDEGGYLNRAQLDILTGKISEGRSLLERFVGQTTGKVHAICLLTQCYIKEGQLRAAENLLDSNQAYMNDRYEKPYCTMVQAELCLAKNDIAGADKLLRTIRYSAVHQPDLLIDFARLAMAQKDYATAAKKLDLAAIDIPDSPWIALYRAKLSALQNSKDTDKWLEKAVNCKYSDPNVLAACARFLLEQGKAKEALKLAEKARVIDPANLIAADIVRANKGAGKP